MGWALTGWRIFQSRPGPFLLVEAIQLLIFLGLGLATVTIRVGVGASAATLASLLLSIGIAPLRIGGLLVALDLARGRSTSIERLFHGYARPFAVLVA